MREQSEKNRNIAKTACQLHLKRTNLRSEPIQALIRANVINPDQAAIITHSQREALEDKKIFQRVKAGTLPIQLADMPEVKNYVDTGLISLNQIAGLDEEKKENLRSAKVRELIDRQQITINQALLLTGAHREAFANPTLWQQVIEGRCAVTAAQLAPGLSIYIKAGLITLAYALTVAHEKAENLQQTAIQQLIKESVITVEQALQLTKDQCDSLPYLVVKTTLMFLKSLVTAKAMTFAQVVELIRQPEEVYQKFMSAFKNDAVRQRFVYGRLPPGLSGISYANKFIETARNRLKIRTNACMLSHWQGKSGFFLPRDLAIKIAAKSGDPTIHNEKTSEMIASETFSLAIASKLQRSTQNRYLPVESVVLSCLQAE